MRKLLLVVFSMLLFVGLAGCNSNDPLENFIKKMEENENAEMLLEMDVPMLGKVEVIAKVDGNKGHMEEFLIVPEMYTEEVDGVIYQYVKDENNKWVKSVQEQQEDSQFAVVDELAFDDFEKLEENKYQLKADKAADYKVQSLIIEITEDGAILDFKVKESGLVMDIKITIRKIGEVSITLPKVE